MVSNKPIEPIIMRALYRQQFKLLTHPGRAGEHFAPAFTAFLAREHPLSGYVLSSTGAFNYYVDRFLALFDHPPTPRRQFIY